MEFLFSFRGYAVRGCIYLLNINAKHTSNEVLSENLYHRARLCEKRLTNIRKKSVCDGTGKALPPHHPVADKPPLSLIPLWTLLFMKIYCLLTLQVCSSFIFLFFSFSFWLVCLGTYLYGTHTYTYLDISFVASMSVWHRGSQNKQIYQKGK